jgi:beta-phosphoglucomutase-like phosphatase (HAD superfamily)
MGVPPLRCVALEDADWGLLAIQLVGVRPVDVRYQPNYPFSENRPILERQALNA